MKTLQDYIKLAGEADDSACHVINAMAEKYPLGADFERYNDDIRKMVEFCSDERNTAMAKALIEAESVLKSNLFELEQVPEDAFGFAEDGSGDENSPNRRSIVRELEDATKKALSQIQALNGGEDDKQR